MSLWLLVFSAFAAPTSSIEMFVVEEGAVPVLSLRPTGPPVAIPACRAVGWEQFDEASGAYQPLPGEACGAMAPARWLDAEGLSVTYEPSRSGFHVVRAVVVYGVGCRKGLPLELADCDEIVVVRGPNINIRGTAASSD